MNEEQQEMIKDAGIKCEEARQAGFHCAESILRGCNTALGLNLPPEIIRTIGGFSGGSGGSRETCGLVACGTALISYYYGRVDLDEEFSRTYYLIRLYHEKFHARFGSIECRVLRPDNVFLQGPRDCGPIFAPAAELLAEVLLNAEEYMAVMPEWEAVPEHAARAVKE